MPEPVKPRSRLRWLRRTILALLLIPILIVAVLFFFTAPIIRWALTNSAYARFTPTFKTASLSMSGTLVLTDIEFHEPAPDQKIPLLTAGTLKVTSHWTDAIRRKLNSIQARDVTIYLRPSAPGPSASSLSLTNLFAEPTPSTAPASPPSPPGAPFWYDTLSCQGKIDFSAMSQFHAGATTAPFDFESQMHGDRSSPSRDFALSIGVPPGPNHFLAKASIEPTPAGSRITLEHLAAQGLQITLLQPFLQELLKSAPDTFHQNLDTQITTLDADAIIDRTPAGATATAHLDLHGLSISAAPTAQHPLQLKNFNFTATIDGPLSAAFLHSGKLTHSQLAFDALSYGKNQFQQFSAPLSNTAGTLQAPTIQFTFAGGDFSGNLHYSLANKKLETADLKVQHLDQKQLAANLAPDKLDAEGTTSGTIHLESNPAGTLTGAIDLLADGPGKLKIKDQQAAEALAQKLQTGAAEGVLPANFSTIVVQQLKDYPYKTGHIQLDAPDGIPNITLNYARNPIKAGDPGYGIQTTLGGQKVLANYTIQLPALRIVLQGKTIAGVLGLATGFENQLTSEPAHK